MPDQEKGNVEYLLQAEAGELGLSPGEAINIVRSWLADDGLLLANCARSAKLVGRPDAAFAAARLVWQNARREP